MLDRVSMNVTDFVPVENESYEDEFSGEAYEGERFEVMLNGEHVGDLFQEDLQPNTSWPGEGMEETLPWVFEISEDYEWHIQSDEIKMENMRMLSQKSWITLDEAKEDIMVYLTAENGVRQV